MRFEAQKEGVTSIILVTTAWQMPHAMQLFRQIGLEINPSPVDYQTNKEANFGPKPLGLFPNGSGLVSDALFLEGINRLVIFSVYS